MFDIIEYRDENGKLIRKEKQCTLYEFIQMGKMKYPQIIFIGNPVEIDAAGRRYYQNIETLYVGNCTECHEPTGNDAGCGWSNTISLSKLVYEVREWNH